METSSAPAEAPAHGNALPADTTSPLHAVTDDAADHDTTDQNVVPLFEMDTLPQLPAASNDAE